MQKILIVEDEAAIQDVLKELLLDAGYSVTVASDGVEALSLFRQDTFQLVLLDIMMPHMDGYTVCKTIRESSSTPIIMLTALDEEEAQVKAFELQVDDFITKPFSLKLVLLRIEAVLRRAADYVSEDGVLRYKEICLDPEAIEVTISGTPITLTHIEYKLLRLFMEHPGRVFTRDNLLNLVWGYDYIGDEKSVNIHIMNLRRKLIIDPIETIRGVGYRLARY